MGLGMPELLIIAGVLVLIFGPRQLPRLGKALGDTVKSFRDIGTAHDEDDNADAQDAPTV